MPGLRHRQAVRVGAEPVVEHRADAGVDVGWLELSGCAGMCPRRVRRAVDQRGRERILTRQVLAILDRSLPRAACQSPARCSEVGGWSLIQATGRFHLIAGRSVLVSNTRPSICAARLLPITSIASASRLSISTISGMRPRILHSRATARACAFRTVGSLESLVALTTTTPRPISEAADASKLRRPRPGLPVIHTIARSFTSALRVAATASPPIVSSSTLDTESQSLQSHSVPGQSRDRREKHMRTRRDRAHVQRTSCRSMGPPSVRSMMFRLGVCPGHRVVHRADRKARPVGNSPDSVERRIAARSRVECRDEPPDTSIDGDRRQQPHDMGFRVAQAEPVSEPRSRCLACAALDGLLKHSDLRGPIVIVGRVEREPQELDVIVEAGSRERFGSSAGIARCF